jgi:hypothetical protein
MLALGFFSVLKFREGKELGPVGFRPPGAPSKNPATACKAEKKKRGQGARTLRKGDLPAGSLFDDDGACLQHGACIAAEMLKGKRRSPPRRGNKKPRQATSGVSIFQQSSKPQISAADVTMRDTRP